MSTFPAQPGAGRLLLSYHPRIRAMHVHRGLRENGGGGIHSAARHSIGLHHHGSSPSGSGSRHRGCWKRQAWSYLFVRHGVSVPIGYVGSFQFLDVKRVIIQGRYNRDMGIAISFDAGIPTLSAILDIGVSLQSTRSSFCLAYVSGHRMPQKL